MQHGDTVYLNATRPKLCYSAERMFGLEEWGSIQQLTVTSTLMTLPYG